MFSEKQIQSIEDLKISLQSMDKNNLISCCRNLLQQFGYAVIKIDTCQTNTEHDKIKKVTEAIRKARRFGKKDPTIKDIASLTRMNRGRLKKLLIKYSMYDLKNKKIINYFDEWQEPDWEESFEGFRILEE